jgi:enoyl-[acyl-carrier protein] reductase/trans-2-enoyl-CoA reductase (NAD+)
LASTGFGLASRISSAFGSDAATIGVFRNHLQKEEQPHQVGIIQLLLKKSRIIC